MIYKQLDVFANVVHLLMTIMFYFDAIFFSYKLKLKRFPATTYYKGSGHYW